MLLLNSTRSTWSVLPVFDTFSALNIEESDDTPEEEDEESR